MLYLFAGDDVKKKGDAFEKLLASLGKDVEVFSISKNNFSPDQIESLSSGSSLFSKKCVVVFENILESSEVSSFLLARLENFKESSSNFIFSEGKLTKASLDTFKKGRAELNIFELPAIKKERFNNFVLANALGERNKFNLWINFRSAINHGASLEELSGVLFWKVKDMILKKNFSKFTKKELEKLSIQIPELLPRARREGLEAEAAFEEFLLVSF